MIKPSTVDKGEAPLGFFAMLKPISSEACTNPCTLCDFRADCSAGNVDFEDKNNRCMSGAVISSKSGLTIERSDGQSVIFKRL
jgi:hypothetical protein